MSQQHLRLLNLLVGVVGSAWACCPNGCMFNGVARGQCNIADCVCRCDAGFQGGDCSERICPFGNSWADRAKSTDNAHNLAECSDRGHCERNEGYCICAQGFTGLACNRMMCPSGCNNAGECRTIRYNAQQKDPGLGVVHTYENVWDANMIQGCHCNLGYFGYDCRFRHCPKGDDPLTGKGDDITLVGGGDPSHEQFNEVQTIFCKASGGKFTVAFKSVVSEFFESTDSADLLNIRFGRMPSISAVSATYEGTTSQACTTTGNKISVIFPQDFGDLSMLVVDGSQLECDTSLGCSGGSPELYVTETTKGTKEDAYCSNRGLCDILTGVCTCMSDFDTSDGEGNLGSTLFNRGDCGYASAEIVSCPGEIACSGHGVCKGSPTYECMCSDGWMGADCSELKCSEGRSWFDYPSAPDVAHNKVECSNNGFCDRAKGACVCHTGYEGGACDRMTCPTDSDIPCSGHGSCFHMDKLAEHALDSRGDGTAYTYGASPNDHAHWDRLTQYGCICDPGYTGFDCTLRTCPFGDDPLTTSLIDRSVPQVDEVQSFVCSAAAGSITLTFRQATTARIPAVATRAELKAALEALTTISDADAGPGGGVAVEYSLVAENVKCPSAWTAGGASADLKDRCLRYQADYDHMCNSDGNNTVVVTFLQEHGDLPPLTAAVYDQHMSIALGYGAGMVAVAVDGAGNYSTTGTKESIECSGRGTCDRNTGLCKCFTGFASSDGRGGKGNLRDCGHRRQYVSAAGGE